MDKEATVNLWFAMGCVLLVGAFSLVCVTAQGRKIKKLRVKNATLKKEAALSPGLGTGIVEA